MLCIWDGVQQLYISVVRVLELYAQLFLKLAVLCLVKLIKSILSDNLVLFIRIILTLFRPGSLCCYGCFDH